MENQPKTIGSLFDDAGEYLETRLDLLKLQAIDKSSDAASSVVSGLTIILVAVFALTVFNIGLSLLVSDLIGGKIYIGFFIVAGFYLLIGLLLHFFRRSWIKEPITGMLIKKMLN